MTNLPRNKSKRAFAAAQKVLVGGVNSPVRAYKAVGGVPPFIAKAGGAHIWDIDGNQYVDYVGSWGPAIVGHAHPRVTAAIKRAAARGASFGAPCELEVQLAQEIRRAFPSMQKVRFVSSGTEAVMSAIRLARGYAQLAQAGATAAPFAAVRAPGEHCRTKRGSGTHSKYKIIKCIGCYHGHSDSMLVSAGSGALTLGVPSSPGVPPGATADTLLVPYNDLPAVERTFDANPDQVAAIIVEPVAGNMGVVPPAAGYLQGLRQLCDRYNALLIFDEVITGFRLSYGGAQRLFGVMPDVTVLGKIIGGSMPVGAFGARAEIMDQLAPVGPVYQAGTLSGNPVAMAAGLATLKLLRSPRFYEQLETKAATTADALRQAADDAGLAGKVCFNRVGSMMTCFFTPGPVHNYQDATAANTRAYAAFFNAMLARGVYLAPSQFEAMFVSHAHGRRDLAKLKDAAKHAFAAAGRLI
jgi:glutamate-1-semialdehyde 2,1-aminomutase